MELGHVLYNGLFINMTKLTLFFFNTNTSKWCQPHQATSGERMNMVAREDSGLVTNESLGMLITWINEL